MYLKTLVIPAVLALRKANYLKYHEWQYIRVKNQVELVRDGWVSYEK